MYAFIIFILQTQFFFFSDLVWYTEDPNNTQSLKSHFRAFCCNLLAVTLAV